MAFSMSHSAQTDSGLVISESRWEKLSEDVDYRETYRDSENKEKASVSFLKSPKWLPGEALPKYLVYVVLFGVLIYLAFRVLRNFTNDQNMPTNTPVVDELEEIEEKIHEVDLDELIKEALEKKNFRVALRLNFLKVIKLLSEKEKITWAREKTNWQYYFELKDKLLADQYKELTKDFEQYWYGERPFSELQYHITTPLYSNILKRIAGNEQ
jgi:hypothetical protein